MKKIFIYYSLTGNGDVVGDYLKGKGYVVRKVNTSEVLPKRSFLRILSGGFKALINYKDKLIDFDSDISEFEEVVIGSPIWNGRLSSPINSVIDLVCFDNKKISFVLYSSSGKGMAAEKMIRKKFGEVKIIHLTEVKKNNGEVVKLEELD